MAIQAPKGTKDVLPSESYKWHYIEDLIRNKADIYGYKEIRTPVFEHTELFLRGVGETTDVVQKEMYTFNDKGNRSITLKPEGTAGAVRAFIEHGLYNSPLPLKSYYFTPVFRYERPQAGRLREHHQFGVEVFGASEPVLDAELIIFALDIIESLGIKGLSVNINSIGCPKCRERYNKAVVEYMKDHNDELCGTCKERLLKNPLRILDCKVPSCKEIVKYAPVILDYICDECKDHMDMLKKLLDANQVEYNVDPQIVRGLDYYVKTVFEIIYTQPNGEKITVCGGGRYDDLSKQISDVSVASAGFGMGLERLIMVLEDAGIMPKAGDDCDSYIITIGDDAAVKGFEILRELRASGIRSEINCCKRSMKAQFKYADKLAAKTVIIIGENELINDSYTIKNMVDGKQISVSASGVCAAVKVILNK